MPAERRLLHTIFPPLPRSGAFASFMPGASVAWLVVFGLTGVLAGLAVGYQVVGGVLGEAMGYRPAIHLGIGAHNGSPIGLLSIPYMIALVMTGKLWLGSLFCAIPLTTLLPQRPSRGRL